MARAARRRPDGPFFTSLPTMRYHAAPMVTHIERPDDWGFMPACDTPQPARGGVTFYPPKPDGQQISCRACFEAVGR